MIKLIILVLSCMFIFGCKDQEDYFNDVKHLIIEIEGCEYITWPGSHNEIGITHKGNCKNSIHTYNTCR